MLKKIEDYSLVFLGVLSIFSWLMPNHYLPWTTFHSDFVMSLAYGIPCMVFFFVYRQAKVQFESVHFLTIILFLACLASRVVGWVPYWTQAALPAIYLFGFLLAVCLGQILAEKYRNLIGFVVFVPPLIASVVSVGLQLAQWLHTPEYGITDIWISGSSGIRPAANMNQPNQLGTLLLWGMASIIWLRFRGGLGNVTTSIALIYLGFGIGLTLSRTAILSFVVIYLFFIILNFKKIKITYLFMYALVGFAICFAWNLHSVVPQWLGLNGFESSGVEGLNRDNGIRLVIWKMFIEAGASKIFFGFGPMMNLQAQFSQLLNYPMLGDVLYTNAHNIFLEIWIWFGLPLAVVGVTIFIKWICSLRWIFKKDFGEEQLFLFMLLVVLVHANLELPLHHAYFLLPTGLLVGVLMVGGHHSLNKKIPMVAGQTLFLLSCIAFSTVLFIAHEYLQIERQVTIYRFKSHNILNTPNPEVPSVILLDQLADQLWFNALDPKEKLDDFGFIRAENYFKVRADCDVAVKFRSLALVDGVRRIGPVLQNKIDARCF
ncbi:Protein glycosylation ligase domain containing protein [Comamonadaceae bacterium]